MEIDASINNTYQIPHITQISLALQKYPMGWMKVEMENSG